ncbi:nucleotidyltransferase family protein [Eisenbergiella tayi]|uniref:D-glycero-alpha-D-manno-heptose 1-phosphate guanylyltransferase n=1 Tax=Eisenbergiella tayi TaxID=1432052 RepID=A0A1E3AA26_9FIRM|nr:nucleotidyltransferase family protein [Eisenbergiella tayi]ODM05624.1 D-glycero-alpha-D-manno-heptose 1-phosphate guanylyltransferase [Eisenbergiella tayi]
MDIHQLVISEEATVLDAMRQLEQGSRKILFILDDRRLAASITDGDIRRWILSGGNLEESVRKVGNYSPLYLHLNDINLAEGLMRDNSIEAVPIVNEGNELISVVFWNDKNIQIEKPKINLPVVMMAGGLGTRLYPYTKILPKPLMPIGEIPIAERIINQFYEVGCNQFFLVVNHKKNMIKAYFNEIDKKYDIQYIDEDVPLGTGGGISLLKGKINSTFILTNCDILVEENFSKIYEFHKKEKNIITMICSLKNFTIPYGVVNIAHDGTIESLQEKPKISFFTNTGCYLVEARVIDELEENRNVNFPELIEEYKKKCEKVGVYPVGENSWLDMGQIDTFEEMNRKFEK